jgi:hypothetical protein
MTKKLYFIHSELGEVKSFEAYSDKNAQDIMACDKTLPKDIQLDLNQYDPKTGWRHVSSMMTMTASKA